MGVQGSRMSTLGIATLALLFQMDPDTRLHHSPMRLLCTVTNDPMSGGMLLPRGAGRGASARSGGGTKSTGVSGFSVGVNTDRYGADQPQ